MSTPPNQYLGSSICSCCVHKRTGLLTALRLQGGTQPQPPHRVPETWTRSSPAWSPVTAHLVVGAAEGQVAESPRSSAAHGHRPPAQHVHQGVDGPVGGHCEGKGGPHGGAVRDGLDGSSGCCLLLQVACALASVGHLALFGCLASPRTACLCWTRCCVMLGSLCCFRMHTGCWLWRVPGHRSRLTPLHSLAGSSSRGWTWLLQEHAHGKGDVRTSVQQALAQACQHQHKAPRGPPPSLTICTRGLMAPAEARRGFTASFSAAMACRASAALFLPCPPPVHSSPTCAPKHKFSRQVAPSGPGLSTPHMAAPLCRVQCPVLKAAELAYIPPSTNTASCASRQARADRNCSTDNEAELWPPVSHRGDDLNSKGV